METDSQVQRLRAAVHEMGRAFCLRDPLALALQADLTPPQIHTIVTLGREELSMGELGRRLGTSGPTITGIVDRLEKLGMLERHRDASDRRVVRLRLTEPGRAAHARFEVALEKRLSGILDLLEDEEREALVAIVEKLARRAQDLTTSPNECQTPSAT